MSTPCPSVFSRRSTTPWIIPCGTLTATRSPLRTELRSIDTVPVGRTVVVGRIKDCPRTLRSLALAGIGLDTTVTVTDRGTMAAFAQGERRRGTAVRAARAAGEPPGERAEAVVPLGHLWVLA